MCLHLTLHRKTPARRVGREGTVPQIVKQQQAGFELPIQEHRIDRSLLHHAQLGLRDAPQVEQTHLVQALGRRPHGVSGTVVGTRNSRK
jgi:hypothetical protein